MTRRVSMAALALATAALGCNRNVYLDVAMASAAHVARPAPSKVGPYAILAGDLHCHILPPDAPYHVGRELPETVQIATAEGLDFVVLTPHVPSRFFLDPEKREWVRSTQQILRARVEALETNLILIPGMEYTDHRWGHVGLGFADVSEVLDALPLDELVARPEAFFAEWQARGGILTINHPMLRPLAHAPVLELRSNLSWRDLAERSASREPPPEVRWISTHAQTIETYNLSIAHLRDQFFLDDPDWTLRQGAHLAEREAKGQRRRFTPVGGTDSHGRWLRPTTWVLATERSPAAIRAALLAGRTCVRGPEACSLEVRGADGRFEVAGASVATRPPPASDARSVEARARGGRATYWVNGSLAGTSEPGEIARLPLPGRCSTVRAVVGASWSAPVYVDCPFGRGTSSTH